MTANLRHGRNFCPQEKGTNVSRVLCPAVPLIFDALSEACRTRLEGASLVCKVVGTSSKKAFHPWVGPGLAAVPVVREGAVLCQGGYGRTMLLGIHQPHGKKEQPCLSMGPSFP